jgi:hypothetical protein
MGGITPNNIPAGNNIANIKTMISTGERIASVATSVIAPAINVKS